MAVGITEKAKKDSGLEVELWAQYWSPAFGTVAWTAFVPGLATLVAAGDKMAADAAFTAEESKGAALTIGGTDDAVSSLIHGDFSQEGPQAEFAVDTA